MGGRDISPLYDSRGNISGRSTSTLCGRRGSVCGRDTTPMFYRWSSLAGHYRWWQLTNDSLHDYAWATYQVVIWTWVHLLWLCQKMDLDLH